MKYLILFLLVSCSSMRVVNQGRVNHQGMDFDNQLTPKSKSFLTNLDSYDARSGGGACTTCAH